MKLCDECGSILRASTMTGALTFECICGLVYKAEPEDSLRYEESVEVAESEAKYDDFISLSAFDTTGKKVRRTCPQCSLDFMTIVYVGPSMNILYTCTCGYKRGA